MSKKKKGKSKEERIEETYLSSAYSENACPRETFNLEAQFSC